MKDFKNCKIWIGDNPDLCRKVQEKLFELGHEWNVGGKVYKFLNAAYLSIWADGYITHGTIDKEEFEKNKKTEIFPSDLGIVENMKFKEGKWYKYYYPGTLYYMRCSKDSPETLHYSGFINFITKEYTDSEDYYSSTNKFVTNEEVPLSEIQQYLTEGHPDKFKEDEYKVGDWVTIENSRKLQFGCRSCPTGTFKIVSKTHVDGLADRDEGFNISTDKCIWRVSKEGVRKATPEEIKAVTKSEKKPFEFNRWYKYEGEPKFLVFISSEEIGYGFDSYGKWFNIIDGTWNNVSSSYIPATDEEVKERLLSYAREKYPVGTKYTWEWGGVPICISDGNFSYNYRTQIYFNECSYCIYDGDGNWAEIVSTPEVTYQSNGDLSAVEVLRHKLHKIYKPVGTYRVTESIVTYEEKQSNILDATYQEVEIKLTKPKQIKL